MRIFWFLSVFCSLTVHAADDLTRIDPKSQKAYIRLQEGEKIFGNESSQGQWLRLCQGLGQNLLANNSSPGFLAEYICQREVKAPENAIDATWRVSFTSHPKFIDVEIQFRTLNKWIPVQSFSFRLKGNFLEDLQKASVQRFLARMIVESLPTGWVYLHKTSLMSLEFITDLDMPLLPDELLIYKLDYLPSKELWLPEAKASLTRKTTSRAVKQTRMENFNWNGIYGRLVEGESYWVQNIKGRNQRQAEYEKKINEEIAGFSLLNLLDRMLVESFTSNYAGLRYGRSLVQGDSIVTQVSLISLLLEVRSGPLNGLRFYYDLTPRTEKVRLGLIENFEMSRSSLGWAWEFNLPDSWQGLISRIDFQPKIGMMSFKSDILVKDNPGQDQILNFKEQRVMNLNAEFGIETESLWLRNRLWTSYSSAQTSVLKSNGVSVTSARMGVDTYVDLLQNSSWDLGLLFFGFSERLTFQRDSETIESSGYEVSIQKFGFNLLFVGGGITISW